MKLKRQIKWVRFISVKTCFGELQFPKHLTQSNHPTFVPSLLSLDTEPSQKAWAVGVQAVGKCKVMGKKVTETATMVERIPNERIVWDGEAMNISTRGTWAMEATADGTKVTLSSNIERTTVMRILSAGIGNIDDAQREILTAL